MKPVRRVLVVQPYGIGDLLFITPVLRALRLLPGIERVDLLLGSRTEAVVRSNPHVDDLMVIDKDRMHARGFGENLRDMMQLASRLRARRYDLMLDYSLRGEYAFWGRTAFGIPRTAGFNYKRRGFFHTIRAPLPEGFAGKHVVDFNCDLAERARIPVRDRWLEFYLTPKERLESDEALARAGLGAGSNFIVVSPGGGESWGKDAHFKRWPPAFFAKFLARVVPAIGAEMLVVLGSAKEKELADQVIRESGLRGVNLAGAVPLAAAVRAAERGRLFVGNDGGLLHVASARRRPVIGFYGPVDPAVYGPYPKRASNAAVFKEGLECRPCYRKFRYHSACEHRDCLNKLDPDDVFSDLANRGFFDSMRQEPVNDRKSFS